MAGIKGMKALPHRGKHSLSDVDTASKIGSCAICGPIKIYYNKKVDRWRCSVQARNHLSKIYHQAYYNKNKQKWVSAKDRLLWIKYRLRLEELSKIDTFQSTHPIYKLLMGKVLGTDHCHRTGLVRGRLEWRINRAYGLLEKVCPTNLASLLRALAHYHEHPPATLALGEKRYGLLGAAKYKKKMIYGSPELEASTEGLPNAVTK